jgi:heat shock protein HslJ
MLFNRGRTDETESMRWSNAILLVATTIAAGACAGNGVDAPISAGTTPLLGTIWQWQAFQDFADGEESRNLTVPDSSAYTLMLEAGTAAIRADCNRVSWSYTMDGSSLRFDTRGPSTMAYCGEASLDQRYLTLLGNTATYVLVDGMLYLNLNFDAGNMVFAAAD